MGFYLIQSNLFGVLFVALFIVCIICPFLFAFYFASYLFISSCCDNYDPLFRERADILTILLICVIV